MQTVASENGSWCARCGRPLMNLRTDGFGSCGVHGLVAAEFRVPAVVVDSELESLGIYVGQEDGMLTVRKDDGSLETRSRDGLAVVNANELGTW